MTINLSDNNPRVSYNVAQGVTQSSFTVSFEFFDDNDLNVYVDGTLKTLTTDYTVSGGDGSTGTVTISVTGATGGSTVVITRDIDLDRTTDFPSSGPFNIGSLNTELDRFVAIAADLNDRASRSLQLSDYDTSVTVVLPDVDDRKGTVLAFNETTGAVEAGPTTSNVNSLAAITDDIATLADIEDGTDATDAIQTVAGISSNVTTVAGVSANVTTVAGISSDVTTVAGISSDTTTVAGISSNVTTVAGISSDVTTAAGISANITTVAGDSADIQSLAAVSTEIGLLGTADAIADMNTLATSAIVTDMDALANLTTEIDALGDVTADITTVSGISANVTTVAGVSANVTTVAGISGNVTTVAGVSSDVTTVAGISANVTTVAGDTTNIATIATDLTGSDNIGTVAGSISNVNLVGGSIANVNTVATNLSGVNSFAERYRVGASDPTTSLDEGDLFFNTTSNAYKFYDGSAWQTVNVSGIGSVADDATPQLGGNLDLNSNDITGTGNISITGEVTADAINLGDNDEITLGTTRSLRMYNNGINSYIVNEPSGFGDLNIYSTDDILFYHGTTASAELMLGLYSDNAVIAYYDSVEKLRTTSDGIDVSGYVYTDAGLVHNGDTNNYINFGTDTQYFYTSGSERLRLDSSGVEINNAYHLPTSDGTSGQIMQTNGSGTVSFVDAAGGGLQSVQVFTSSGTWTKPSGITKVIVHVQAGGGGGQAATGVGTVGGAAAGGGYARKFIDVSAISSETVTVGAGGAGGASSGAIGSDGGTSSFGSHCSATGGAGGTSYATKKTGGTGTGGDINIQGGYSEYSTVGIPSTSNTYWVGGVGGDSMFGFGTGSRTATSSYAGVGYGSGASGTKNSTTGADGAPGIIIVEEYA